ncbi:outer membrane lipoprotein-sorting protein [candidate division KSB1 bacterium]|nr:outer membrane lipoprotein-sorting protein [candidate division KSB1 bacterium]
MKSVMRQQGRWYPKIVVYRDMLSGGKGTEFKIESIEFNADIPNYIFSKTALRR